MPLSENEQRILDEIETHLHTSDPRLAREVGRAKSESSAPGSIRWAIAGVAVGLILVIAALQVHFLLSFVGFALMLVSALGLERQLRSIGRSSIDQMTAAIRTANPTVRREEPGDNDTDAKN